MKTILVSINARQRQIIYALLTNEKRVTLAELAKLTNLSSRIIRYNLDVVKAWFEYNNVNLISRRGYGIEIDASKADRKRLLSTINELMDCDIILSRQQRIRILMISLLLSEGPIAAQNLAENEAISRSTIFKDIQEVEKWFYKHNLKLERQTNKGLWVTGNEESRRFALLQIIRDELGEKKWHNLANYFKISSKYYDKSISIKIENFINELDLTFSRKLVDYIEHAAGRSMSIKSRVETQVYLAIAIHAMENDTFVIKEYDEEIAHTVDYEISQLISNDIKKRLQINIPEGEIQVIAAYLLSCKWAATTLIPSDGQLPIQEINSDSLEIAQEIVSVCSKQLHPLLKIDQELIDGLAIHLDSTMNRLKYGLTIRNSYLEDTKLIYPEIYRSAERGSLVLAKRIGHRVPPEEVAFLTMYLAAALERLRTVHGVRRSVIIASDGIRAKPTLLKARLEYEFSNLNVIEIMNNFDWDNATKYEADIIISTMPLENQPLPIIHVSPFLNTEDIRAIQKWLTEKDEHDRKNEKLLKAENVNLVDLLELSNIRFEKGANTWQEAVQLASQPLQENEKISRRYIDAMVRIINEHGAYMAMGDGALLLHAAPTDGVNELCLSLLILEEGISFGNDNNGPFDIIFVLGAVDGYTHLTALFQLSDLLQKTDFIKELREVQKPASVLRTVWRYLPDVTEN
jgi:transcriptional antiterminator/mannitol/fructose-specific phosphotransferase system IIA component